MTRMNRYVSEIIVSTVLFFVLGCKKFVQVPAPTTQIVTASVFSNDATATSAETAIYTAMESNEESYFSALNNGLLADELQTYSVTPPLIEFYTNAMLPKDIINPWGNGYNYIYLANAVIQGLQGNSQVTITGIQQLTGEAKFIRAFWHFYLANCYGDVPLVTTTGYNVNATISRTAKVDVYKEVIADLEDAENSLSSNYVDATNSTVTLDRIRPTKSVAAALLARVQLYAGHYDSAEQQATIVINNTSEYTLCQSLDSVFLANNTEAIWQLPPTEPSSNPVTPDGEYFILTTAPGSTNGSNVISQQLMSSFESGDLRQQHWIGIYTDGISNYYFPYKYKLYQSSTPAEYNVVLRLAEQYLIRAEARAQQGETASAIADLNMIRNRAGLPNYSGATDQSSLLAAVLHERQVELFTEWGHRWFDLNRTGNINAIMGVVTPLKGGSWNPDAALYPISVNEIKSDPNLVQNPGY